MGAAPRWLNGGATGACRSPFPTIRDDTAVTRARVTSCSGGNLTASGSKTKPMNAVTANASTHPASDNATHARWRRRAIIAAVGAGFLGLYVLGVTWFANELQTDMQRNLQLAPAVQDVAHR